MRVYAMDVVQVSGTDAKVFMRITSGSGDSVYVGFNALGLASVDPQPFPSFSDFRILGPGQTLAADTLAGGADSLFTVGVYGAIAPLGTVFYA